VYHKPRNFRSHSEEIRTGIVGQGGDGGIDSIYTFINGEPLQEDTDVSVYKRNVSLDVVIIQSKVSPSFAESAIDKLVAVTEDLFDLARPLKDLVSVYNKDLLSFVERFRKAHDDLAARFPRRKFSYYYLKTTTISSPMKMAIYCVIYLRPTYVIIKVKTRSMSKYKIR
jgi:hypothetical protein